MGPRAKKRLFDAIRIAICGAALWFVIQGVTLDDHLVLKEGGVELVGSVAGDGDPIIVRLADGRERAVPREDVVLDSQGEPQIAYGLKTAWRNSTKMLLLLAVLMHFPVAFFQGVRLQCLLRAQDIHIGYWECVKLSFAGNFVNFATPLGSHAGDVFKAYCVTKHTERKTEAATTIALDRAIGLGTLIVCVAAITTFGAGESRLAQFRPYMLGLLGVGAVCIFAYLSPTLRKYLIPRRFSASATGGPILEQLRRIDQAARSLAGHKRILAASVLITVILQVAAIGAYFTVALALALDAHAGNALEFGAYFYTGAVIQALPGPPQGLGTVELAYRYFFAPFGSPSQIVCVAFAVRLVVLVCSLPGLFVTLTGSYKPREAAPAEPQALSCADHRAG